MLKIDRYRVKIYIDLDNGLYIFPDEAATGKTRCGKLLGTYGMYGYKTKYLTYVHNSDEYREEIMGLRENYYEVIMLDRCDMSYDVFNDDEVIEKLTRLSKSCIVLADCKGKCKLFEIADLCFIDMAKEEISISQ